MLFSNETDYSYDPDNPWYKRMGFEVTDFRGHTNIPRIDSLFAETIPAKAMKAGLRPIFTINEFDTTWRSKYFEDNKEFVCYSLHRIYIGHKDPHEYNFAMSVFGSYEHWCKIAESVDRKYSNKKIKNLITLMRANLEQALRSEGTQALRVKAAMGDTQAAKFLASKEWHKEYISPGRPSKEQLQGQKKIDKKQEEEFEEDAARVFEDPKIVPISKKVVG